ncbi:MAG TPA: serine hydrolase [Holophagaceae bacterium]|nr:serine hydrolase [Holophagaceae bacterium]
MRNLLLAFALLTATAPNLRAQGAPDLAPTLDAFIAQGMKAWRIPGLSVVVVKDGKVLYEKGFGVRELGKPGRVDTDTRFGMMSTTKAMTALALGMLVDEGKVAWDDPILKHLPAFRLPNAYLTEHVTVRDALRHSAGLENADLLWDREDLTTPEVLARLDRVPTTRALRSDFIYHNVMYQVAGEVIAAASGMSWERFISTRILTPLGMTRSTATLDAMRAAKDSNVSVAHFEIEGQVRPIEDVAVDRVPAAGAIWSTAHDAGKWLTFLLAGGVVGDRRLVSEHTFKELLAPQVAISAGQWGYPTLALTGSHWTTYGLGWFQQDYRGQFVAMHTGSMDGRTAIIGLIPDAKVGVYAFGNLDHAEFRHALLWKVLDLCTGAPARDWNAECLKLYGELKAKATQAEADLAGARVQGTHPSHPLEAYVGTYTHPAWGDLAVVKEGDALVLRMGPSPRNAARLAHWHYDTFRGRFGDGRGGWTRVGFTEALDGAIGAVILGDASLSFRKMPPPKGVKP